MNETNLLNQVRESYKRLSCWFRTILCVALWRPLCLLLEQLLMFNWLFVFTVLCCKHFWVCQLLCCHFCRLEELEGSGMLLGIALGIAHWLLFMYLVLLFCTILPNFLYFPNSQATGNHFSTLSFYEFDFLTFFFFGFHI